MADLFAQLESQDRERVNPLGAAVGVEQSDSDTDRAIKIQRDIEGAAGYVDTWRQQASEDDRYYCGSQWSDIDRMKLEQQKRPALV